MLRDRVIRGPGDAAAQSADVRVQRVIFGLAQRRVIELAFDIVDAAEYDKLLNGSFKVITRGLAAPGFDGKDASANLQVTFTFAAFEE